MATINLPPACALRGTFASDHCASALDAKRQVCARVVQQLQEEGQVDAEGQPVTVVPPPAQADISWPHPCPSRLPLQGLSITRLQGVAEWPPHMVLTLIKLTPEPLGWANIACLSAHAMPAQKPGFALQFELGEEQPLVRIEHTVIPWPPSAGATAHIRAFNWDNANAILPDGPETVAVVPLVSSTTDAIIDWDRICSVSMKGKEEIVPVWLLPLSQRIATMQRLSAISHLLAPIGPMPNPLRIEAVLSGGFGQSTQAFEALELQGRAVIRMFFSVAYYIEHACDNARHLEARVKAAINSDRLASLTAKSGLCAEVIDHVASVEPWLPRISDVEHDIAERMLVALVGAYVGEKGGDFYSVVKLWEWLSGSDELMTAVRYLGCATTEYTGMTPTYTNFKQAEVDDGTLELHVYYQAIGLVRYRRPEVSKQLPHGQYLLQKVRDSGEAEWCNVRYDHCQETYVWNIFQVPDINDVMMPAALPKKIQRWLRGTCAVALINYKRCGGPTMVHDALQEKLDGSLHVLYKAHGWYCYTRCPKGGLGFEEKVENEKGALVLGTKPVFYSEKPGEKTLFSPRHSEEALPNTVTEWLMTGKSLFQLVSIVTASGAADDIEVKESGGDHISWLSGDGQPWRCCREHVGCSTVYMAGKEGKVKPLVYQGQTCQTEDDDQVMPERVIKWLKNHPERKCDEKIFKAYIDQQRKKNKFICTPAPLQMQSWFPQLHDVDFCRLQQNLCHTFSNKMLLAEALLHTSGNANSMTPDCQRLAFVGEAVAVQLVTRILIEDARFSTAATLSQHDISDRAKTFAVGPNASLQTTNSPTYRWPEARGGLTFGTDWPFIEAGELSSPEKLRKRLDACCNNIAYARTAVELGLHKGMRQGSPELQKSVQSFEKAVARFKEDCYKTGTNPWHRLLRHDAPRALGNTFIACLGAIVMDGAQCVDSYFDAKKVLEKHVADCKSMPINEDAVTRPQECGEQSSADLVAMLQDSRNTLCTRALAPPPPPGDQQRGSPKPTPVPTTQPQVLESEQVRKGRNFIDVHVCYVNKNRISARSPRSAVLRAPFVNEELSEDEKNESVSDECENSGIIGPKSCKAEYCEDCVKWLNGPTQIAEHKIGTKHKTNVRKGGVHNIVGSAVISKANKTAPKAKAQGPNSPPQAPNEPSDAWHDREMDNNLEMRTTSNENMNASMAAYGSGYPGALPYLGAHQAYPPEAFAGYPPFPNCYWQQHTMAMGWEANAVDPQVAAGAGSWGGPHQ